MAFEDSTFINGKDGGVQFPMDLPCRMDFYTYLGIYLPLYETIDDDRIKPDLPLTIAFPQRLMFRFENLSSNFPSRRNTPSKSSFLQDGLLSRYALISSEVGGGVVLALVKKRFSS